METKMGTRFAVVEFGSRGVRLLIADASPLGISRVVYSTGGFSELGKNQDEAGYIAEESFELSKKQASDYVHIAQEKGAEIIFGFATEVVRSAPNRQDFLEALSPIIDIKTLGEEEEALYSFLASMDAFRSFIYPQQLVLVIDQGGGSIELAYGCINNAQNIIVKGRDSFPLGTIPLTKLLVEADDLPKGYSRTRKFIQKEINARLPFQELSIKKPFLTIGLGSAITRLAGVLNEQAHEIRKNIHGQFIDIETIRGIVLATHEQVKQSQNKSVRGLGVDSDQATLISGVLTFHDILNLYNCNGVTVSRHGLRYGVLLARAGLRYEIENYRG